MFARANAKVLGLNKALDVLDRPVLGLDRRGRVVFANSPAESILRKGDGLAMLAGRLACSQPASNRRFQALVADALSPTAYSGRSSRPFTIHLPRKTGAPLQVFLLPFPAQLSVGVAPLAALVFVSDPQSRAKPHSTLLQTLYGLTPSEARVARLLYEGLTISQVADELNISVETSRFHAKRILAKTCTKRQSHLIKLMSLLPHDENASDAGLASERIAVHIQHDHLPLQMR